MELSPEIDVPHSSMIKTLKNVDQAMVYIETDTTSCPNMEAKYRCSAVYRRDEN